MLAFTAVRTVCLLFTVSCAVFTCSAASLVLHSFTGSSDGRHPQSGVIIGAKGVLYGTTQSGGVPLPNGNGTIYELTPPASPGEPWTKTTLYSFNYPQDGGSPYAGLAEDKHGNLYGTNYFGGQFGAGTVFRLAPPCSPGDAWTYTVLYSFTDGEDGGNPYSGVVIGPGGVLFGTTQYPNGAVWALSPPSAPGDAWTETTLYTFTGGADGKSPQDPYLTLSNGRIYGSTVYGGAYGNGAIYSLTPEGPGKAWKETVLYSFTGASDGIRPVLSAIGPYGELYGTTDDFSTGAHGSVYELIPPIGPPYGWTYTLLYSFTGGADGGAPGSGVSLTANGNLIGTANQGGFQISPCGSGCGVLFELKVPATSGDQWTETTIYKFSNQSDGSSPLGLIASRNGFLYTVESGTDQGTIIGNGAVLSWTQ